MKLTGILLALAVSVGCYLPNKAIRADYASYNQTIQHNQSQQMLLNLVRLKYRETPFFMKVGALSASYSYSMDGSANFGVAGNTKAYGMRVGAGYSTRPTITYTPLEGNTFVQQVLAEVEVTEFALLVRSGWPIHTLCNVMVEQIDGAKNDLDDPSYERFKNIVTTLSEAKGTDNLSYVAGEEEPLLQIRSDRLNIGGEERGDSLKLHTLPLSRIHLRSFLDIMFFLGKNTIVPEAHAEMVKTSKPNGWMTIHSSADEPDNAMVSVRHRGYYFSISNTDLRSKDIFALLKLLYQMQAGDAPTIQPLLTIPL